MSKNTYVGRHRPAAKPSRGRHFVVPVALLSSTVAGGLVVRDAGASPLSAEAAAMKNINNTVQGLGLMADPNAVAAATADRGSTADRASRDSARIAALSLDISSTAEAQAEQAANAAAANAAAAKKAAVEAARAKKLAAIQAAHRWVKPFSNYVLTSGFGWRWGKMHPAQDLAAPVGTPVRALSTGTVIFAGWSNEGYGYKVEIRYWDGTVSWYAHNSRLLVRLGDKVEPGEVVSYSGNTGNSTGPHLHLEIRPDDGAPVAPRSWLAKHDIYL